MTELRGKIKVSGTTLLTCCDSLPRVYINDVDLRDFIMGLCGLDSPLDYNDHFNECTFQECSANKVMDMLYSSAVIGCYSTWTCGVGGYDFVMSKDDGHSLFKELASFDGMYVWISFGDVKVETEK